LILYIHGFRTTAASHKARILQDHYPADELIIADYPIPPLEAIAWFKHVIETKPVTAIIAISLGGYYATFLAEAYRLKAVLINPSVMPYRTLAHAVGTNRREDGTPFVWRDEDMKMLERLKVAAPTPENYFVFLQTGDAVLDYRVAERFYAGSRLLIEEGGSHRFERFERFLDDVSEFLRPGRSAPEGCGRLPTRREALHFFRRDQCDPGDQLLPEPRVAPFTSYLR